MTDPDTEIEDVPEDLSDGESPTTIRPSAPWNSSWESVLTNPANFLIVGALFWTTGVLVSQYSPLEFGYEAPAAIILSVPGLVLSFIGFTLIGTGSSVLWDLRKSDKEGSELYDGKVTIKLSPTPLLSLLSGVATMAFIAVTIYLTMNTTGPLYNGVLSLVGGGLAIVLFLVSYLFDFS